MQTLTWWALLRRNSHLQLKLHRAFASWIWFDFYLYISACRNRKCRNSRARGNQADSFSSLWLPFYCIVPFIHVYIKAIKLRLLWQLNRLSVSTSDFSLENKRTKVAWYNTAVQESRTRSPQPADTHSITLGRGTGHFEFYRFLHVF